MKSLMVLVTLCLSAMSVWGQAFQVPENGLLRLPNLGQQAQLDKLDIAKGGKLLIPASIEQLTLAELTMGKDARISVAPRGSEFVLILKQAQFSDGSVLAAVGSHGDVGVPGGRGTDLRLVIESTSIENLVIDTRGGQGGNGWPGSAGESGKDAACWGFGSSAGTDGGDGSNGLPGGDGGNIILSLAESHWLEVIDIRQQGGAGGQAGAAGAGGKGGGEARCWLYSLGESANNGKTGQAGQPAQAGRAGILSVQ